MTSPAVTPSSWVVSSPTLICVVMHLIEDVVGLSGIGLEMTRMLLERGANVTVTYRDPNKARQVRDQEFNDYSNERIAFLHLDCASLPS